MIISIKLFVKKNKPPSGKGLKNTASHRNFCEAREREMLMIQIEDVYFSYTGMSPYVLEGIDLKVEAGDYISVLGGNGSGKSTLVRLILKLIKPSRGKITVQSNRIGYVAQRNETNAGFPLTVNEMLNSYRKLLKIKEKNVIENRLREVGMQDYGQRLMGTLSGGQYQKILIARALLGEPQLLILDEPSTGVDIESQKEIYRLLKQINQEKAMTIISVEHNMDAAITNSSQIYHMRAGRGHLCSPENYAKEFLKGKGEGNVNIQL